ncbi:MAG: hypothetical protein LAT57_04155, partial [Balneolales bacterium]|nr:hypothetical protein [Balneolales bacterium]
MFFRYFAPLLVSIFLLFPSQNLYSQTLEEKIGQMLMVSLTSLETSKDTLLIDIQTRNIGGVLFFQNTLQNPTQIANLMSELQDAATVGLFLATDQEGGNVARLNANNGYSTTTSAEFAGSVLESVPTTRSQAATMAGWLADAGINVNLAPVVDVNVNPNSPAIGRLNRSYSDNPAVVAEHAIAFMDEHSSRNIITSTKHFPGHGSALADS